MNKKAFITGITGQDGSVLARILLDKGYEVHGLKLYSAVNDTQRLYDLDKVHYHYGDMTDAQGLDRLIRQIMPNEIYNLAAMSHVHVSFDTPVSTFNINLIGTTHILEALRSFNEAGQQIRFYQASSSEMFGCAKPPQNEKTAFDPCSPYGISKHAAYSMVKLYREAYGLHASNGILFNHESPCRGEHFVTRKITKAIGEIEAGQRDYLTLGNLDAKRDWGHAKDYMTGAWQMLQQDQADDYVLATGEAKSVRNFVETAFRCIGVQIQWEGQGANECGYNAKTNQLLIKIDPKLYRPAEVHHLLGDATKAKEILGWNPNYNFYDLVAEMVEADRIVPSERRLKIV